MEKEKVIKSIVNQVLIIAEEWTLAIADGKDPVHKYADRIFYLHQALKEMVEKETAE